MNIVCALLTLGGRWKEAASQPPLFFGVSPESLKDGVSPESLKDCRLRKGIALKFQAWHQFSDCQGWPQQTSEMQG
jgi:hypothetical protein